jgi:hypothetical protein
VTGVSRNAYNEVTFATLRDNLNAADDETSPTNIRLLVTSVLNTQTLRIGPSGLVGTAAIESGASEFSASNAIVQNGKSIYWKPVTNVGGSPAVTVDAVKFRALDTAGAGQVSATEALLKMTIDSGTVVGPAVSVTGGGTIKSLGTNFSLGAPFDVSFTDLETGLNLVAGDNPNVSFVVTTLGTATLKKGSQNITGTPSGTPASGLPLVRGETLLVLPTNTASGTATMFSVRAFDSVNGLYSAAEITLTANFAAAAVNQVPFLTSISDFLGGLKDTTYGITYASLRAKSNVFDAEESPEVLQTVTFKITSIDTTKGNLYAASDTGFATPLVAGQEIAPSNGTNKFASIVWKPDANTVGFTAAFTVKAFDGTSESASAVAVNINIPINTAPQFVSVAPFIPSGVEDVQYFIDYNVLSQYFPGTDGQTGTLGYKLTSVASAVGTLSQNGVTITGANLPELYPGSAPLVWTPPVATNGILEAFKMKLTDGSDLSAEATVNVSVASVNNPPVISSVSALTSVAKTSNKSITFTDVFNAINFIDRDFGATKHAIGANPNLKFRIESVGSGTLRKNTNAGAVISPIAGDINTMPMLVASSPTASEVTTVNWTPSQGLTGTFVAMTVRIFDGTDFSHTTANIQVPVTSGNNKPVYTATTFFTLGVNGGTAGTSENGALQISYSTLLSLSGATDADGEVVRFKVPAVSSGVLTVGNTEFDSADNTSSILLAPGDRVVWAPAANTAGTLDAFSILATDLTEDATSTLMVKVVVSDVNTPPTLNATGTESATRNTVKEITYAALKAALSAADVEDDTDGNAATNIHFYIEDLVGGQKLTVGTSGTVSLVNFTSQRTVSDGQSVYWTPPANATGTFDAFIVTAVDSSNTSSLTSGKISVSISGSNQLPNYGSNVTTLFSPVTINRGASQSWSNGDFSGSIDLINLTGATDPDSSLVSLVITDIYDDTSDVIGTFRKGTINLTAYSGSGPVAQSSIIAPGERIDVVVKTTAATGTYSLFKVKAFDGLGVATGAERVIQVTVAAGTTNAVPTLSTVTGFEFTTGTTGSVRLISYDDLRNNSDVADAEEYPTFLGESVKFRITETFVGFQSNGTTKCDRGDFEISKNGAGFVPFSVNGPATSPFTEVGPNDVIRFTPKTTGSGTCKVDGGVSTTIFKVKAVDRDHVDGGLSGISATDVDVNITVP